MKKISLNGDWQCSYVDNACVKNNDKYSTINEIKASTMPVTPAVVPGNFELDLYRAGVVADPYFGENTLEMQKYENKHVWYFRTFEFDDTANEYTYLVLDGIDTLADIYINGEYLTSTDNMLIDHKIKLDTLRTGANEIVIHIKPAVIAAREYDIPAGSMALTYNYDSLYIRKASHMYGWDIMPRIVSCGIWRDISIIKEPVQKIKEIFAYTTAVDTVKNAGDIAVFFGLRVSEDFLKDYKVVVDGKCGDSLFHKEVAIWHTNGRISITIPNCKFWWPKNSGEQNLYDISVSLYYKDELLDTYTTKTGVRTIELDRTSITDIKGSGEFCFKVNGKRIFILGTNWVPVDAFHSNDANRVPKLLEMLDDIGCNAVRCWGGNVYEDHVFFDFCDEKGILVWQDFAMGCAAYPHDDTFVKAMEKEVVSVVKKLRNHTSIALWAGDNECDYAFAQWSGLKRDPNNNIITRKVIPQLLEMHDFTRPYLPSSPYMDEVAYQKGTAYISEDHLWGPRDYYKSEFYKNSLAHFASEIGYHGVVSPESVKKFISADKIWPYKDNDEWIVHAASPEKGLGGSYAYRIELMAKQVRELFGVIPDNYEEYAIASQISQAEAFKFFIELFRSMKWRRTGIIWWNLADGWPQFSDAIVDYYYTKKLAYSYIKTAQSPVLMMFAEPSNWQLPLMASNNTPSGKTVKYRVTDLKTDEVIVDDICEIAPDSSVAVWNKNYSMSDKTMYLIEWEICGSGEKGKNHYLCGNPTFDLQEYLDWIKKADLFVVEGF